MILAKGKGTQEVMLAAAPEKHNLRVERIAASRTQSLRLVEMGVVPGAEVAVVKRGYGMVVLRVGGTRLALARGMADCIWVK